MPLPLTMPCQVPTNITASYLPELPGLQGGTIVSSDEFTGIDLFSCPCAVQVSMINVL